MLDSNRREHQTEGRLKEIKPGKRALLIGVYKTPNERKECQENIIELESLNDTYGMVTIKKIEVHLRSFDPSTYLGKGKVQEISDLCKELEIDVVIFDDEIAPHQQRNLERIFEKVVLDRTELILGVFDQHARTKEARIQVDLAQLQYELPRIRRMWTHLERQRTGGNSGGYLKGAGEKQIEIDRQILKDKIFSLKQDLEVVIKQRETQRKARQRSGIPSFAIVGYTNSGKSTLLNALTDANVLVEDKLFATLDTTTRKFILPNRQEVLLIDTVGFIRKIPHGLVAAFKSTLIEALEADILLHLIDVSSPRAYEQSLATYEVLKELHADNRPIITLFNKIDQAVDQDLIARLQLEYRKNVLISALNKTGFHELTELMVQEVSRLRKVMHLKVPQSHYALVSELMKEGKVISCDYEGNDILLVVEIPASLEAKAKPFQVL